MEYLLDLMPVASLSFRGRVAHNYYPRANVATYFAVGSLRPFVLLLRDHVAVTFVRVAATVVAVHHGAAYHNP